MFSIVKRLLSNLWLGTIQSADFIDVFGEREARGTEDFYNEYILSKKKQIVCFKFKNFEIIEEHVDQFDQQFEFHDWFIPANRWIIASHVGIEEITIQIDKYHSVYLEARGHRAKIAESFCKLLEMIDLE